MLRAIRRIPIVNKVVRRLVKGFGDSASAAYREACRRWPVSGVLDVDIQDVSCRIYAECDDGIADVFYYGLSYAEENDLRAFAALARKSRVILDIGANTGLYTIVSAVGNPSAEVFAFEPYEANLRRLQKNCGLNSLSNVRFVQMAVGNSNDPIEFAVPASDRIIDVASVDEEFAKRVYGDAVAWKKVVVEQTTVDAFRDRFLDGRKIDLIKIDVESNEMNVFRGMDAVLRNDRPDILVEVFVDDERKIFFDAILESYNYFAYTFMQNGLLRANDGFQVNKDGLNFLLSTLRTAKTYTPHAELEGFYSGDEG